MTSYHCLGSSIREEGKGTVGAVKEVYDRPFRPEVVAKIIDESREQANASTKAAGSSREDDKERDCSRRKGWFPRNK